MTPYAIQRAAEIFLSTWTTTSIRYVSEVEPALPYIEPHVLFGSVTGLEIQGAAERVGVIAINIFTVRSAGDLEGLTYGGALEVMFWHEQTGNLFFENGSIMPSTSKIGVDEVRQAFHHQAQIPFSVIME